MVIELSEQAAARVAAAARARGVTESVIVKELTRSLTESAQVANGPDLLDAFIGCGSSGDRQARTIHELRDELSAVQLRDSA